ncbi:homoserine dehydrogenase [Solilutibacter silvestris]|uniref:homoserine dehydrogenase n=1 Tax=Solilutibacter silvestris TaxID=1645665 RepID=A0A2K1PXB2_9GAMM|nr:homoserine dehydrogenase [Lysobacter silvestris]PNS07432.1 Homoserine dehydrogenase [Lysobacter silvestris]
MSLARVIPMTNANAALRMTLLGTGTVGSAFVERLAALQGTALRVPALAAIANSRGFVPVDFASQREALDGLRDATGPRDGAWMGDDSFGRGDIVVDATASAVVADRHGEWLRRGAHVVTACKIGQGSDLARWSGIQSARRAGATHYGDSATVGAGLPLLRSIRMLKEGGDRVHAIAGVLSGSLAWLFNHYDGMRPFSGFVREARDAGYTEPDPRDDLSGEDVRRKILILARTAGVELESADVAVQSLVPEALAALPVGDVDAALPAMDEPLRQRFADAHRNGEVLKFIARLENGRARVGLESLPSDHPLAGGAGTDNRVAIWSDRYNTQPLVIQGPGAGAEVTAAALLDDVLAIRG